MPRPIHRAATCAKRRDSTFIRPAWILERSRISLIRDNRRRPEERMSSVYSAASRLAHQEPLETSEKPRAFSAGTTTELKILVSCDSSHTLFGRFVPNIETELIVTEGRSSTLKLMFTKRLGHYTEYLVLSTRSYHSRQRALNFRLLNWRSLQQFFARKIRISAILENNNCHDAPSWLL